MSFLCSRGASELRAARGVRAGTRWGPSLAPSRASSRWSRERKAMKQGDRTNAAKLMKIRRSFKLNPRSCSWCQSAADRGGNVTLNRLGTPYGARRDRIALALHWNQYSYHRAGVVPLGVPPLGEKKPSSRPRGSRKRTAFPQLYSENAERVTPPLEARARVESQWLLQGVVV